MSSSPVANGSWPSTRTVGDPELAEVRASLLELQHRVDRLDPAECEEAAICVAIPPDDRPRR